MILRQMNSAIFKHYGFDKQLFKLLEEMKELKDEVDIHLTFGGNEDKIAGELADVMNMCDQIAMHIGQYDIKTIQHEKCDRQLKRMEGEGE